MAPIDSIKDDRISTARALATRSGRVAAGRCLIAGASLIGQVVAAGGRLDYVLCSPGAGDQELRDRLAAAGVSVHPVRDGLLQKVTGSAKPEGWLAVAVLPPEAGPDAPYGDFAVVCERVADPGNLGTIVRTARALGVADVVLTDQEADLSSRRVLEAARGAVLGCRVRRFADPAAALAALRGRGFQIVVTSPRGSQLQSLAPLQGRKLALVVGNETAGVSAATVAAADLVVQIPMAGPVESLNVAVAAGISIYELRMRLILAMLEARLRAAGDLGSGQVVALMVLAVERRTPLDQLSRDQLRDMLHRVQANAASLGTSPAASGAGEDA